MKFNPNSTTQALPSREQFLLEHFRKGFDVEDYVTQKVDILSRYFEEYKIKTAIVAISGGIDSALVAALMAKVRDKIHINVIGVTLPALENSGVTGQTSSMSRANEVLDKYKIRFGEGVINLTPLNEAINETIQNSFGLKTDDWAKGQAVSYLRTTILYSIASMLTTYNMSSVIVGTTNRDEGLYLGYIGKASDGMVDLQPISDLHKSQVRLVAKYLDVPQSILDVTPTGDMFDGRTDEEVFGASYDTVELALNLMNMCGKNAEESYIDCFGKFGNLSEQMRNIDALHCYNKHKYLGGSPAVHFDLTSLNVQEGWKTFNWNEDES